MNKNKTRIYVVSIILLVLVVIAKNVTITFESDIDNLKTQILSNQTRLKTTSAKLQKIQNINIHSIFKEITKISNTINVSISKMQKKDDDLILTINAKYENIAKFLNKLEHILQHFSIKNIILLPNQAIVRISFKTKTITNISNINLAQIVYPFQEKRKTTQTSISINKQKTILNLSAIMNKSVKINTKWYKVFDTVDEYQIVYIAKTYVRLKNIKTLKYKKLIF